MSNILKHVKAVREEGLTIIPNVFTKEQCKTYVDILESIVNNYPEDTKNRMNPEVQSVNNYFRHNHKLLDIIYIPILDDILKILIHQDHVLISANTFNRRLRPDIKQNIAYKHSGNAGHNWHIDSDYVGGKRLCSGFSFQVIVMLEDFGPDNGATHYVPGSHKDRSRPDRDGDYPYKFITGEAGSIAIMDSGMWHRSGSISEKSRWGAFNMYGPWFVKPYFRFYDMLGHEFGKQLSPQLRRLLHYRSIPPLHEEERLNTVVREAEN